MFNILMSILTMILGLFNIIEFVYTKKWYSVTMGVLWFITSAGYIIWYIFK